MEGHYSDLWQAIASADPDRLALKTVDGETWTYGRFAREAGSLAAWLERSGVRPGDTVAMLLHNRAEFLITFFACLAAGITPVPLNFRLRPAEVAALLDDSGSSVLIHPASLADVATEAAQLADVDVTLVSVDEGEGIAAGAISWAETVAGDEPLPPHAPADGELWIYTGGTTGRPKAVRWSAPSFFEVQLFAAYTLSGRPQPETMDDAIRISVDSTYPPMINLPLAPFMHGTALTTSMNTLAVGGTVLISSRARLDAEAAVRFANAEGATRLIVAGDAIGMPIADAARALGVGLPTVASIMSSGMRFSAETKKALHELGDMEIIDLLASTEGGGFAVTSTKGVADLPGRAQLFPTAVVFDENFRQVQDIPGSRGILAQRGALPLGYHRDLEKTRATFPEIEGERYVIPGDWVIVQDDRHIEFIGRGSGVINTGGEKVYPLEVEEALLTHPAITDAAVLGVPDPRFGEVVAAVVVRSGDVTADELAAHVGGIVAGYKKPRHVMFRESLDRTPTGKIDVGRLRGEVIADRGASGGTT
ncbi:AMP-binding protein [Microbacterium sp. BR1]|uniref:AMP-binding protein n=1 Tax=Microbacterium sp. BR1 TaxID=1070896 RepID=UPI0012FD4EBE|nr:AMP-binding protein [Microbacterium sp. BR1]